MNKGLVSIVVPIYNVEKYLERCINSIVNQTYRNLETILVDDGSPDNCPQMCDEWTKKDNRIKVIHKQNSGLGMARNTGIECAQGEYICFFDSDDYIDLRTIEKAYTLANTEKLDIVVFGVTSLNRYGNLIKTRIPKTEKICYRDSEIQAEFLPDLIDSRHDSVKNRNLCLSAWSCLFSVELIRRNGWRFVSERENISEDSYSLIKLYKYVNSVGVLSEALYFYCENENSLTRTYREDRFDRIKRFYFDCSQMAEDLGYCHEIKTRISGLFLSFTLAAMKQIVIADMDTEEKRRLLKQITEDETMQSILRNPACRYRSKARRVLFCAMRAQMNRIVYGLVKLQARKNS